MNDLLPSRNVRNAIWMFASSQFNLTFSFFRPCLGATKHLNNWLCPLVCRSVGLLVCRVTHLFVDPYVAPYWPTGPCYWIIYSWSCTHLTIVYSFFPPIFVCPPFIEFQQTLFLNLYWMRVKANFAITYTQILSTTCFLFVRITNNKLNLMTRHGREQIHEKHWYGVL